jgi:hypothetical protein
MTYKLDWHLEQWMKANLIQNTAIVIDMDNDTIKDALYISLAKDENLIQYTRTKGTAMIFDLTPQGEIALGIPSKEINALERDILVYLHRVAKFNPHFDNTRSTDSLHEAVDRAVEYSLLESTLERMLVNGKIEKVYFEKDSFWRYLDTPENAVLVANANDNTIIVLNPTEEHLLRLIAERPHDAAPYQIASEHAVDGLIGYRFIQHSNHDGHLHIMRAGEQWIAEHPLFPKPSRFRTSCV